MRVVIGEDQALMREGLALVLEGGGCESSGSQTMLLMWCARPSRIGRTF